MKIQYKIRFFLFFLLTLSASPYLHAQLDTSFWFVAPEVCEWNNPTNFDRPIKLVLSSPNLSPTNVTISQPANSAFTPIQQTIPAEGNVAVDLTNFITSIEDSPVNTVLNHGIHISSSQPVNAYYEVGIAGVNPETYALKGRNAFGTEFVFPGQNEHFNGSTYQPTPLNRMDIVATQDGTSVTITPKVAIDGHPANVPFSVQLNRGQTYCCAATGREAASHFQGTVVSSNLPIAITHTDDLLDHGGQDLVGDQIVPVSTIGKEYIAIKGSLNSNADRVYITAVLDNTHLFVDGSTTATTTLSAGSTYALQFPSSGNTLYLTSDQPVYAYQLTGIGGELGGALLPTILNTGSTLVSYRRETSSPKVLKFNITARAGTQNNFTLNGNPNVITAGQFHPVDGTNGSWLYASVDIPTSVVATNSTAVIKNPAPFHLGIFEGASTGGCSYGFFSDYQRYIQSDADAYVACQGELITINITSSGDGYTINWFEQATGGSIVHTGTSNTVIKNQDSVQYIYAQLFSGSDPFGDRLQIPILLSEICGDTLSMICQGTTLFSQDFGGNDPSDPNISPNDFIGGHSDLIFSGTSTSSGHYCLAKKCTESWAVQPNWDHTHTGDQSRGYFMYLDPAPNQLDATLYEIPINGLCDNARLNFSLWAADLQRNYAHPAFEMQLLNAEDTSLLVRSFVVNVPRNNPFAWHQYGFPFTLPDDVHDVILRIVNKNADNIGNDWAIDDVQVTYCGGVAEILTPDTTLCLGEDITLSALFHNTGIPDGSPMDYAWQFSPDGNNWLDLPNSNHLQHSLNDVTEDDEGFYRIHVAEAGLLETMCSFSSESIFLNIDSCIIEPCDTLFLSDTICSREPYFIENFSLTSSETNYVGTQTFERHITGPSGCDSLIILSLTALPLPHFQIISSNEDFCQDMFTTLTVEPSMMQYLWSTGETSASISVEQPGNYSVSVSDGTCEGTQPYVISSCPSNIFIPNAISFTEQNGLNDYFQIVATDLTAIYDFSIYIYNRWGGLVYCSQNANFKWRPKDDDVRQSNNIFNYIIRYKNEMGEPFILKGSILVL